MGVGARGITERKPCRHTQRNRVKDMSRLKDRQHADQANNQADRQADRQTDRQIYTDRRIDKETDGQRKHINGEKCYQERATKGGLPGSIT